MAYDDESVYWYDQKKRIARIDLAGFGNPGTKLEVDTGFATHFFGIILEYLMAFKLLGKDGCFCHSSAVEWEGKTIVFPAWRHVGKTNLLLGLLDSGARYIADDWTVLFRDGRVLPIPKRLNLLYYNFSEFPRLAQGLEPGSAALLHFVKRASEGTFDLDEKTIEVLRHRIRIRKTIQSVAPSGLDLRPRKADFVILLRRRIGGPSGIQVVRRKPADLSAMVQSIVEFEQMHFHVAYTAHVVRTGRRDPTLEQRRARMRAILEGAFTTIGGLYEISFPTPMDPAKVQAAVKKLIAGKRR